MTLPKGSGLIVCIWGVHRNPKYWGPDAHCFDPDRFLPERCKYLHPCAYIPFSHGPRNCLGKLLRKLNLMFRLTVIKSHINITHKYNNKFIKYVSVKAVLTSTIEWYLNFKLSSSKY